LPLEQNLSDPKNTITIVALILNYPWADAKMPSTFGKIAEIPDKNKCCEKGRIVTAAKAV
jgi:hypothetical protein